MGCCFSPPKEREDQQLLPQIEDPISDTYNSTISQQKPVVNKPTTFSQVLEKSTTQEEIKQQSEEVSKQQNEDPLLQSSAQVKPSEKTPLVPLGGTNTELPLHPQENQIEGVKESKEREISVSAPQLPTLTKQPPLNESSIVEFKTQEPHYAHYPEPEEDFYDISLKVPRNLDSSSSSSDEELETEETSLRVGASICDDDDIKLVKKNPKSYEPISLSSSGLIEKEIQGENIKKVISIEEKKNSKEKKQKKKEEKKLKQIIKKEIKQREKEEKELIEKEKSLQKKLLKQEKQLQKERKKTSLSLSEDISDSDEGSSKKSNRSSSSKKSKRLSSLRRLSFFKKKKSLKYDSEKDIKTSNEKSYYDSETDQWVSDSELLMKKEKKKKKKKVKVEDELDQKIIPLTKEVMRIRQRPRRNSEESIFKKSTSKIKDRGKKLKSAKDKAEELKDESNQFLELAKALKKEVKRK